MNKKNMNKRGKRRDKMNGEKKSNRKTRKDYQILRKNMKKG
jgi:hypothetical protein